MVALQTAQDLIAQNLANANTVGYKQDTPSFRALHGMAMQRIANGSGTPIGELGAGVESDGTNTDWQPGVITTTNNPLDASLGANQFLAVGTGAGVRFTRAAQLQVDSTGNVLTSSGAAVLNTDGKPINVAGKTGLTLDAKGNLNSGADTLAKLQIVRADPHMLEKQGNGLFRATSARAVVPAANPDVRPGTIEQANVNVVQSMVQLVNVSRSFDAMSKALLSHDDMLKHAANDLGKV
jgi:flagellar basal-body rod protein FlgG